MNFNIPPHYPQTNGKAERGPRRQEDIEAVTSLSCTFVVPSKTSNIHRHEPLPFDNGKINPHPPTYIGIQLEAGSTEPRSCYQKGRAIQNCIPSALWQETWLPLRDLKPGDSVRVKLDQQKGCLGKSLQEALLPRHMSSKNLSEWYVKTVDTCG